MKKVLSMTIIAMALVTVLTGCNTVRGAGQDISATGHVISKTATEAKR